MNDLKKEKYIIIAFYCLSSLNEIKHLWMREVERQTDRQIERKIAGQAGACCVFVFYSVSRVFVCVDDC